MKVIQDYVIIFKDDMLTHISILLPNRLCHFSFMFVNILHDKIIGSLFPKSTGRPFMLQFDFVISYSQEDPGQPETVTVLWVGELCCSCLLLHNVNQNNI